MTRNHRQLMFFAACSALMLLAGTVGLVDPGLLPYLVPVVVAVLPLLAGRFVGEDKFTRVVRAFRRGRERVRSSASSARRTPLRHIARGGALIAEAIASRPPPAVLAFR